MAILGRMKMKSRSVFFLLPAAAALLVLSACGNKGPLVMPQKPVPMEEPTPAAPALPADPSAPPADTLPEPPPATDAADPAADTEGGNG